MTEESQPKYLFCKQLTLLFIGLKLTYYIDWSWVWIVAPLWGGALLLALLTKLESILEAWLGKPEAVGKQLE